MKETFIENDPLSELHFRALTRRSDAASCQRMLIHTAILVLSYLAVAHAPTSTWRWSLLPLHGLCHLTFFGLLHETCHRTAFKTRWLNTLGGWLAALSHPLSPAMMRAFHFAHHRHTHDVKQDPELAGMVVMARWPRHVIWLGTMTGLPILTVRCGWTLFAAIVPPCSLWDRALPFVKTENRSQVGWEARLLVMIHVGLLIAGFTLLPQLLWFYAGLLLGHAFLAVYTTCEHRGLPSGGSVETHTRSLKTLAPLRWVLWNMPYHAEHHAWPAVPWHALPALHHDVRSHLPHRHRGILSLYWRRGRA